MDDSIKGGDLDLLIKLSSIIDNPALLSAEISARISKMMLGRKVDIVLEAPNLKYLDIHQVAHQNGVLL